MMIKKNIYFKKNIYVWTWRLAYFNKEIYNDKLRKSEWTYLKRESENARYMNMYIFDKDNLI